MNAYVLRRIILIFPLAFAVVTVVFLVFYFAPGDPARIVAGETASTEDVERLRTRMGLDDPLHVQYGRFLGHLARGNLGTSLITHESVGALIVSRVPTTLQLSIFALLVSVVIGVSAGLISAIKRNSIYDYLTLTAAVIGYCIPNFWVALLLIIVFSVKLQWLPSIGKQGFDLRYLILPAAALSAPLIAIIARLTRSGMLEVLSDDYIVTARAKGLRERSIVLRHGFPNALVPIVTIIGLQFGGLIGGTIVVETLFSWPGMGWLLFTAVSERDYPLIQGIVIVYSIVFMLVTLAVDIAYSYLDPRVRYD